MLSQTIIKRADTLSKSIHLIVKSNADSTLQLVRQLKNDSEKEDNQYGLMMSHYLLGRIYRERGEFDKVVENYLISIQESEVEQNNQAVLSPNQRYHLSILYLQLGNIFRNYRSYALSAKYLEKGMTVAELTSDTHLYARIKASLVMTFEKSGEFERAIRTAKSNLEDDEIRYHQLLIMGWCYNHLYEYDSSILVNNQILDEVPNSMSHLREYAHNTLGEAYSSKGDYDNSEKEFLNAQSFREQNPQIDRKPDYRINIIYQLAKMYLKSGEIAKAREQLHYGEQLIESEQDDYKHQTWFFETYQLLFQVYDQLGDQEKSAYYNRKYDDELELYTKLHQRYDMDKIVQSHFDDIETAEKEATTQLYIWIVAGGLILDLAILLAVNYLQQVRTRKKLEKKTIDQKLAELKALKAQINPHFLFNALNSIQTFILDDKQGVAESYLVKYGQLMRKILDHSNELTVTLNDELKALKLYLELEQIRVKHGFDFEIEIDEKIDPYETYIPSMVIQPFLENAIWHGISKLEERGKITVNVVLKDEEIEVKIVDNGVGFELAPNGSGHTHSGVRLVKERLELLKESAEKESVVSLESEVGVGTTATLQFPDKLHN